MPSTSSKPANNRMAHAMLLSILYQDRLALYLRIAVGFCVAIVAFTGLVGIISLELALRIIFYSGLVLSVGLWLFIRRRRIWLLNIKDPELKRRAHAYMLAYLASKGHPAPGPQAQPKKKNTKRECTI